MILFDIKIQILNMKLLFFIFHLSLDYAVICHYCRLYLLAPNSLYKKKLRVNS